MAASPNMPPAGVSLSHRREHFRSDFAGLSQNEHLCVKFLSAPPRANHNI
jgi:hypothetical protein